MFGPSYFVRALLQFFSHIRSEQFWKQNTYHFYNFVFFSGPGRAVKQPPTHAQVHANFRLGPTNTQKGKKFKRNSKNP